jgi:hypothetical protein
MISTPSDPPSSWTGPRTALGADERHYLTGLPPSNLHGELARTWLVLREMPDETELTAQHSAAAAIRTRELLVCSCLIATTIAALATTGGLLL